VRLQRSDPNWAQRMDAGPRQAKHIHSSGSRRAGVCVDLVSLIAPSKAFSVSLSHVTCNLMIVSLNSVQILKQIGFCILKLCPTFSPFFTYFRKKSQNILLYVPRILCQESNLNSRKAKLVFPEPHFYLSSKAAMYLMVVRLLDLRAGHTLIPRNNFWYSLDAE
jgi:hypothetical protein